MTGRLFACRAIQARLSHKKHVDERYCHAIRRLTKEFALQLKKEMGAGLFSTSVAYVSSDDKAKVPVGEPGCPVETGVRAHARKKNICPVVGDDTTEAGRKVGAGAVPVVATASDHSFTKCSVTPSVNLFMAVPSRMDASWLRGHVVMTVNDSVFASSDGWKHAATLSLQLIRKACTNSNMAVIKSLKAFTELDPEHKATIMERIPWLLLETTDGGSDHKNATLTNRCATAAVVDFFDMGCAILFRNAPSGNWANPVERIMSILNIALQNCLYE